ncbi:FecR family protein [Chitinophaga vietnamensis]|uniref:FecR family protein n=1 Tax=Chitinophaga vietnamensis TaxID=2593957 RepID=UPI001177B3F4|nr:FecR domain-containing protein [Chitinophaga vietnamensis]
MDQERLYHLLAREIANELTTAESEELQQLLQQYPHASYIREVFTRRWQETSRQAPAQQMLERHLQRLQQQPGEQAADEPAPRPVRRIWLRAVAAAASIALIAFAGWRWLQHPVVPPAPKEQLVTLKGTRSHITLPDGSQVWLNAGSRLNYPKAFADKQPRIVQLEGEAFFDVAADANRPFRVQTKSFTILVMGTAFNVRAYPGEDSAVTSLVQGAVQVQLDKAGKQLVALRPNEKLTVPANLFEHSDEPVKEIDNKKIPLTVYKQHLTQVRDSLVSETAWVKNKLAFKHLELEKVSAMLEQWYGVEIGFRNNKRKQLYFTGVFETDNLDNVLEALASTNSFSYTKDARGKIWIE